MPWFKVDDKLWGSPKWIATPPAARALWVTAGSWAADQLQDGVIPAHVIPILGGTEEDAMSLVTSGLWDEIDQGWAFHDWDEYQPSRESILDKRAAEAKRKAEWRAKKTGKSGPSPEGVPEMSQRDNRVSPGGVPNMSRSSRPDPTRPISISTDSDESVKSQHKDEPDDRFDEFWDTYDKKVGKKKAEAKWRLALKKRGVTADLLIESARTYIAWQKSEEKHPEFTKDPTTWLTGEHWNDERPSSAKPSGDGGPKVFVTEEPPDGLSADEYRQWYDEARKRAAS